MSCFNPKKYVKSIVYGGLDGIITIFSIVASTSGLYNTHAFLTYKGASISPAILLILGCANLLADAISMSVGDYLSSKAEEDYEKNKQAQKFQEVSRDMEATKLKVIEVYRQKGFSQEDSITLATILCKDKMTVTDILMSEDANSDENAVSPTWSAAWTFTSFIIFGLLPLLTFVLVPLYSLPGSNAFWSATILTACTLWILGAMKAKLTMEMPVFLSAAQELYIKTENGPGTKNEYAVVNMKKHSGTETPWSCMIASGLEMLMIGGSASVVAYCIAWGLSSQ